ncbi:MAG TPA: TlpA disulfide reductase family protein [Verrucomicrobiae bacterium]|jgi:peroxiredoxin|nr:TlpA disulfide reductase family protein [Verrucomicrobiae bacterium]
MARTSRWAVAGVAAVVAALLVWSYFQSGGTIAAAGPAGLAGSRAPSFSVVDTAGRSLGIANFAGKTIVLNLWASWCPPCRAEMPDLERLYRDERARGVIVIGIDQGESVGRAAAFARSLGITYPILVDDRQQYGGVYAALGLPSTFVIDSHGTIVRGFDGPLTYAQMRDSLRGVR